MKRLIGTYSCHHQGALLFITAGIHGNEPSGVIALKKVFTILQKYQPKIKGTIVGIRGNVKGLKVGKRYIEENLNRVWTKKNIRLKKTDSLEKKEMFKIIDTVAFFSKKNYAQRYFLDCHTTSSVTKPFISVQNINDNDSWAHLFSLPIVRGFSDIVNGCIDHYFSRIGMTGFVHEAGQHNSALAIKNQEWIIWRVIEKACNLTLSQIPELTERLNTFRDKRKKQPTFKIIYRHTLADGDQFSMKPGFSNFQKVHKGELLATHNEKKIISCWNSYIFMPLYQSQGKDGFFIINPIN